MFWLNLEHALAAGCSGLAVNADGDHPRMRICCNQAVLNALRPNLLTSAQQRMEPPVILMKRVGAGTEHTARRPIERILPHVGLQESFRFRAVIFYCGTLVTFGTSQRRQLSASTDRTADTCNFGLAL
jgi:hypothetical protein